MVYLSLCKKEDVVKTRESKKYTFLFKTCFIITLQYYCLSPFEMIKIQNAAQRSVKSNIINQYSSFSLNVSVPSTSMFNIVTVRCGHCANLLSVNMGSSLLQTVVPLQDPHQLQKQHHVITLSEDSSKDSGSSSSSSSSKCNKFSSSSFESAEHETPRMPPIRPPEKRQRVPSAYNRFIKEEIQRIKASNPEISHREAFSTAAKNWAHFPHIHFGLKLDGNKQAKLDQQAFADHETTQKSSNGFY